MHEELEKKLADEKAMFRSVIDAIPDVVFFKDVNSAYLGCNSACERFLGIKESELVGKTDFDVFDEAKAELLRSIDRQIIASGEVGHNSNQIKLKDGSEVLLDTLKAPFYDHEGNIKGIVGISRDVTKLQTAVNELSELNQKLEQKVAEEVAKNLEKNSLLLQQSRLAAMGEMMGAVAHQWRQPLNALGIIVQDIKIAYKDGELSEKYIEEAVQSAMGQIKHMSSTIDDFRRMFKIDKEKEEFMVKEAIIAAENILSAQFEANQIEINTKCKKEKCDGCKSCTISINSYPNELKQVFLSLLSNAKDAILENRKKLGFEYMGEVSIDLELDESDGKSICKIVIKDNGGGIDSAIIDRVFEPYFTTKGQGEGSGVGLYMARSIIKGSLGGDIYVHNNDSGAEFVITLPIEGGTESVS